MDRIPQAGGCLAREIGQDGFLITLTVFKCNSARFSSW